MILKTFFILIGLTLIVNVTGQTANCTGPGWTVYGDALKCIKLIEKRVIRKEALAICKQESNIAQSNSATSSPKLLTITSQSQQNFLNEYLFAKHKLKSNVWIGAKRFTPSMGADYFVWEDGTKVEFGGWAKDHPTTVRERPCVAMVHDWAGQWKDLICQYEYYVVCEREMHDNEKPWSLEKLTKEFLDTRKKLTDTLEKADIKINNLKKDVDDEKANTEKQINSLKKKVENEKANTENRFKKLEKKVDEEKVNSEKQINNLKKKVDDDKANTENRFKKLEKKVDDEKANTENRFKKLEKKVDDEKANSEKQFNNLKKDVENVKVNSEKQFINLKREVVNTRTNLTNDVNDAKIEIINLKREVVNTRMNLTNDVNDAKIEIINLKREVVNTRMNLTNDVNDAKIEIINLKREVVNTRMNLTNDVNNAKIEIINLEKNVEDTRKNLTNELKIANKNITNLENNIEDTRKNLTNELKIANKNITNLENNIEDTRKNLTNELKIANKNITNLEKDTRTNLTKLNDELKIANEKIDQLIANSTGIPIGFIYTQLQNEKTPYELFGPRMNWTDVSADYAGLFFRVIGNGSEEFGKIQEENSPRMVKFISGLEQDMLSDYAGARRNVSIASDGWSESFLTGYFSDVQEIQPAFINFKYSGGEVRPRNKAIRVWKRTA